jgi:LPS export ABC transporter protein LptC
MSITRTQIKLLAVIVALSAVVAVAVTLYRFKAPPADQIAAIPKRAANAILASTRVHHTATRNGRIQWELEADSAQMKDKAKEVLLQSPDVVFFSDDGRKFNLTATRGRLNTKTNNLVVGGAVHLFNRHYDMHTEKLIYLHGKRLLESRGAVKIFSDSVQLQANAMTYEIDTEQAHFTGQVEGTIFGETGI